MLVVTTLILVQCEGCKCFNQVAADTEQQCKIKLRFGGWDIDSKLIHCPRCKIPIHPAPPPVAL